MRRSRLPQALSLLVLPLIAGPVCAASETSISVCIRGEPPCFSAFAVGFEVSNVESSNGGGGSSAVETTYGAVSIIRGTDSLTPVLFRYAATGMHFAQVVITVTPKDQPAYTITLREASISRFKPAASVGQQVTQEVVDFRYWEVCVASEGRVQCGQVP